MADALLAAESPARANVFIASETRDDGRFVSIRLTK
jgi:hypothetical protein